MREIKEDTNKTGREDPKNDNETIKMRDCNLINWAKSISIDSKNIGISWIVCLLFLNLIHVENFQNNHTMAPFKLFVCST